MAIHNVKVPLYDSFGEDVKHELFIDEFAGRMQLNIKERDVEIKIECSFDDLERAWNAVKR